MLMTRLSDMGQVTQMAQVNENPIETDAKLNPEIVFREDPAKMDRTNEDGPTIFIFLLLGSLSGCSLTLS